METLISASVGLAVYKGEYYLQVISERENHYWVKIPKKVAYALVQQEMIEAEEIDYDPTKA